MTNDSAAPGARKRDIVGEIVVTAGSEEEALAEILKRWQVAREAVEWEVRSESLEELLPDAKPEIEVHAWLRLEYVADRARTRLGDVLRLMDIEHKLEVEVKDRIINIEILTDPKSSSLLIGREGQNLEALQYLINRMAMHAGREAPLVMLDVEGYRKRQYRDLERLVERAVKRAKETGNEIELDPMPSSDRKYLHHYLSRFDGVKTFSRGEEPDRYLVIVAD